MKELNIQTIVQEANSSHAHQRKKKTNGNVAAERTEAVNEHPDQQPDGDIEEQPKKNVRGCTTKADIFARQNKPKLEVQVNERGQPCWSSSTEFSNFIGALVRTKGFPVAHDDWRKVCPKAKWRLWTDAQLYWKLDASVFNWFMKTTPIKWKEFKSYFRKLYDDDMEDNKLLALCDERVHEVEWKWLIDHWRSPEAAAQSLRGKESRSMLSQNHTSSSKSHARVDHELGKELGHPHAEMNCLSKLTHTTTLPHKGAERIINALKDAIRDHP
ncbi:hypothetical protein GUJ93_ZPchr0005g15147 [Zizania palustris]|uniref:Uncharacterized protein n=1 Tax=Zizania palustris TaxID=103762 RepID=A0A8J5SI24_ZIZPA|nr:hypothetical protein GUJ93_ZPchr0005g15147 [Zizania palustris]